MLVNPRQFGGLTMRTVSQALAYVVLFCLLLSLASGSRRLVPRAHVDHRFGRERHHPVAHLRRCREDYPAHHPVRPCLNVLLPPDEDAGDRLRLHAKDVHERWSTPCGDQAHRSLFPVFGSRPLPTEVPRHQIFCLLLI